MASVFLSYDREDTDRARPIAKALENAGHSVWWDRHIRGGSQFSKEIEEALARAQAVVVLWSKFSIESAWVRDEAAVGRDTGRLVPARIDEAKPPLGFRQFQTIDLSRWKWRPRSAPFRELLTAIAAIADGAATSGSPILVHATRRAFNWRLPTALMAIVLAAAGYFAWTWLALRSKITAVAVSAVDASPVTRALARDLLVKLGSLQGSQVQIIRIVDTVDAADLVFRVSVQPGPENAAAGLDLLSTQNDAVLWSRSFTQPSGKLSDLQLQLAFTATRVLDCALQTRDTSQGSLDQQTIKLYLNGCAQLDEHFGAGGRSVIPLFQAVVRKSPRYKAAWGKLLMAEAAVAGQSTEDQFSGMRTHIAEARKLDPNMPEATIAEVALLPLKAFAQAGRLLDRAKEENPDNALILASRGDLLRTFGRMRESIEDTKRAVELDPLSPSTRGSYVLALAYAGRIDAAQKELHRFEMLWPGTGVLQEMQFRFYLRFGDPHKALEMARSLDIGGENQERFLIARANPTKDNIDRMIRDARRDDLYLGFIMQALGEFHREEKMFELAMNWPNREEIKSLGDVWFRPALSGFRRDPRFMKLASEIGLVAYWTASGKWPDYCSEPDLPYNCQEEAANVDA